VGDPGGALARRDLDQQLGDQRTAEGGRERILALIERPRPQRRPAEAFDERAPGVQYVGACRPGGQRPLADRCQIGLTAQVDRQRNYLEAAFFNKPLHGDRGVEATGVGEHDFFCHQSSGCT